MNLEREDIHNIILKIVRSDSLSVSMGSGDESVDTTSDPDKFVHYELRENPRGYHPVDHQDPSLIPVTDTSIVVAVWTENSKKYERYYDSKKFKEKYF